MRPLLHNIGNALAGGAPLTDTQQLTEASFLIGVGFLIAGIFLCIFSTRGL
jgi:hypothetical protein